MDFIKKHIPDFGDPRNEVVVYGTWLMAMLNAIWPLVTEDTFTTKDGFITFLMAAVAIVMRSQVSSKKTVAKLTHPVESA